MKYKLVIQNVCDAKNIPNRFLLQRWINETLTDRHTGGEVTLRMVDEAEMSVLNLTYRQKSGSTNVLSFPFDMPDNVELDHPIIGDIIICPAVVSREAILQDKTLESHWAHMVIHGTLHLLGYDHQTDQQADEMESLEITLLQQLGFTNPYTEKETE